MKNILKVLVLSGMLAVSAAPVAYAQTLNPTEQATFDALPEALRANLGALGLPPAELARIIANVSRLPAGSLQALTALPAAQFAAMASLPAAQVNAVIALPPAQRATIISAVTQIRADVLAGASPVAAVAALNTALAATGNSALSASLATAVAVNVAQLASATPPGSPARAVVQEAVQGVAQVALDNGASTTIIGNITAAVASVASGDTLDPAIGAINDQASGA